jgi:hypothetical protein
MEASPGNWRRARLRSPTRPPAVSDLLWRQLTELAAVCQDRRDARTGSCGVGKADTIPPGVSDTILSGKKDVPDPTTRSTRPMSRESSGTSRSSLRG